MLSDFLEKQIEVKERVLEEALSFHSIKTPYDMRRAELINDELAEEERLMIDGKVVVTFKRHIDWEQYKATFTIIEHYKKEYIKQLEEQFWQ